MLPKYIVYYMDNDRQRVIVTSGLFYHQAVKFMQKYQFTYYSNCSLEMEVI